MQNILDGVEIAGTDEELKETCEDIEEELKKRPRKSKRVPAEVAVAE